jgi:antitoxin component HigA of HigAB toxin-antitoxin module
MSSLLEQAIVDAKALKEAALKNAEASIIEKYSSEVKSTLDKLLEQEEEPGLDADLADLGVPPETGAPEEPLAGGLSAEDEELFEDDSEVTLSATDGLDNNDVRLNKEEEEVPVTVNLDALREAIEELESQLDEDEEIELNEEDLASLFEEEKDEEEEPDDKAPDPLDEMVDAIMEKMRVDTGADLSGWAGMRSEEKKYQMERGLAARKSTGVDEEIKAMKKAQEELVFENKNLKTKITQLADLLGQAKDNLQEVNVSNARLLYTNRVLRNTSLNERQKTKIVEAISKVGSVKEAKTIFESLQSTVASTPNRRPQSLSEAISRPSQLIRASRKIDEKPVDPYTDRWKKLAGI